MEKAIRIVWNILGMLFNFIGIQKEPEKKEEPKKEDENWNSLPSTWTRFLEKMKKVVVKLAVNNEKSKKKAMKIVSSISGVNSVSMDIKDGKLTVTGDVDPVVIVRKLRKICFTEIVSVGPEKKPKKKKEETEEEEKDEEPKDPEDPENSGEPKNKKEEPKKKGKKKESKKPGGKYTGCYIAEPVKTCHAYNPHMTQYLRYLPNVTISVIQY